MKNGNIKITLLGDSTTGKTSIVHRIIHDEFPMYTDNTIGANYSLKTIDNIKYEFWDTAGQERYASLVEFYYRDTDIFMIVFDVSNLRTMCGIKKYCERIKLHDKLNNIKIIIVANKIDIISQNEFQNVEAIIKKDLIEIGADNIIFLSAKNDIYFDTLIDIISKYGNEAKNLKVKFLMDSIRLNLTDEDNDHPKNCNTIKKSRVCLC